MADELTVAAPATELKGAFQQSLYRNNKQIRKDRADSIIRLAQVNYKRSVEDLALRIEQQQSDLEGLLDLSPTNTQSLVLTSDFNAADFAAKDQALRLGIYNDKIKLKVLVEGYFELFGEKLAL